MRRIVVFALVLMGASRLFSQASFAVEGYVTAVHLPGSFQAAGRTVVLLSGTAFGVMGMDARSVTDPARGLLRVGAYVQVTGSNQDLIHPVAATEVLVRDDQNQKLGGMGVITRVVTPGQDAVYEADGYLIHIGPKTKISFEGDLSTLTDITENMWIRFAGKRNADGVLEATHAQFFPGKATKFKSLKHIEVQTLKVRPARGTGGAAGAGGVAGVSTPANLADDGAALEQDAELKVGLVGRWHTISADQPLQQRVHRVGMSLVPEYQRQMDGGDPSKIHFRFFAVDDKGLRDVQCVEDGVIVVSKQAVERLTTDDELAALLAAGVAAHLQRQGARQVEGMRKQFGISIAEALIPGAGLAAIMYSGAREDPQELLEEERLRIGLALMRDAGYDPWQAPQAWRLVTPKKLPSNLATLEYPDQACYQISVLNVQYPRRTAGK